MADLHSSIIRYSLAVIVNKLLTMLRSLHVNLSKHAQPNLCNLTAVSPFV